MIRDLSGINWPALRIRVRLAVIAARCKAAGVIRSELEAGQ